MHPRADEANAPLFPAVRLTAHRPTGVKAADRRPLNAVARRQATVLATQTVEEAELRLDLDWNALLRQQTFYKAVYRPAVLRASAVAGPGVTLPPSLKFHAPRHTYASLCVAAGIPPLEIARFMGHAKVTTTLTIYAHLFEDDHSDAMAALGAMGEGSAENVLRLRG